MSRWMGMIVLALSAAVAGCSTGPKTALAELGSAPKVYTLEEAATDALPSVTIDGPMPFELGEQSPVLDANGVLASFQRITVETQSDGPISVEVQSYCNCVGLVKYVMVPRLFLVDSQGEMTELKVMSRRSLDANPSFKASEAKPASLLSVWSPNLAPGAHSLVVVADNQTVGTKVAKLSLDGMMPLDAALISMAGGISMVTHPYGKFEVRVVK